MDEKKWREIANNTVNILLKRTTTTQRDAGQLLGISQASFANKLSRGSIRLYEFLFLVYALNCDLHLLDPQGTVIDENVENQLEREIAELEQQEKAIKERLLKAKNTLGVLKKRY